MDSWEPGTRGEDHEFQGSLDYRVKLEHKIKTKKAASKMKSQAGAVALWVDHLPGMHEFSTTHRCGDTVLQQDWSSRSTLATEGV